MAEDLDDHRRIFDVCPGTVEGAALRRDSGQAMIFKAPPQFGQCSTSTSKTRLSSRAQLMRGGELVGLLRVDDFAGVEEFQALCREAGFEPSQVWIDDQRLFSIHYLQSQRG